MDDFTVTAVVATVPGVDDDKDGGVDRSDFNLSTLEANIFNSYKITPSSSSSSSVVKLREI